MTSLNYNNSNDNSFLSPILSISIFYAYSSNNSSFYTLICVTFVLSVQEK